MSSEVTSLLRDVRSLLAALGNRELAKAREQQNIAQHNLRLKAGLIIDMDTAISGMNKKKENKSMIYLRFPYPDSILNEVKSIYNKYYQVEIETMNKSKFIVIRRNEAGR